MPNPVLTKLDKATRTGAAPGRPVSDQNNVYGQPAGPGTQQAPSPDQLQSWYDRPSYTPQQTPPPQFPPAGPYGYGGGGSGGGGAAPARYMTLDSVVTRTGMMLMTIFAVGAVTWQLAPTSGLVGPILIVSLIGGLGLGLYMAFTMKANAFTALLYSVFQGALLGAISRAFNSQWPGIVVQALTGTVFVAAGMLVIYKTGVIRVTPKFTRIVIGATFGVVGLMVVNLIASFFTDGGLGLRDGGALAIIFSLVCIVIAAANLVLDFDMVEQGIRHGADEKFAWYASFGIVMTLIWLYLEILRLLGYLRD